MNFMHLIIQYTYKLFHTINFHFVGKNENILTKEKTRFTVLYIYESFARPITEWSTNNMMCMYVKLLNYMFVYKNINKFVYTTKSTTHFVLFVGYYNRPCKISDLK